MPTFTSPSGIEIDVDKSSWYKPTKSWQVQKSQPSSGNTYMNPGSGTLAGKPAGLVAGTTNVPDVPGQAASPTQPGVLELFNTYKNSFKAPSVNAPAPMQYRAVAGPGQSYYDQQKESIKEGLRRDFFGPLGRVQQTVSGESAAGRLGSGVGKRIIEETAMNPFAQAITAADRDVNIQQGADMQRIAELNASMQAQYDQQNNQTALAYTQLNQQAAKDLDELIMSIIQGDMAMSDQDLNHYIANKQLELQQIAAASTQAQTPFGTQDLELMKQMFQGMTPEEKEKASEYYEKIFSNNKDALEFIFEGDTKYDQMGGGGVIR